MRHAERMVIPPEIADHKIPKKAKYEIEHFLQAIVNKYGLAGEEIIPRNEKDNKAATHELLLE